MTAHLSPARRAQRGMTLIEVLVAILIVSFGLLGFVGLQARAIQYSTSAEDTNRAALLANEVATAMVIGRSASRPDADWDDWRDRIGRPASGGLPNGVGSVFAATGAAANERTVRITWRALNAASGAANSINKYETQVVIPETTP